MFNDLTLAETVAQSPSIILTAIGHAQDVTLVERVADKRFPTPTALGNHLHELAEEVEATNLRSRAAIVDEVRKEFQDSLRAYDEQVNDLQRQIGGLEQQLQAELRQSPPSRYPILRWVWLLLAVLGGLLLGRFLN